MQIPMQPSPVAYKIVADTDPKVVEAEVNTLLKEGYTLHGPTTTAPSPDGAETLFVQPLAMVEMRPVRMGKMDNAIIPIEGLIRP